MQLGRLWSVARLCNQKKFSNNEDREGLPPPQLSLSTAANEDSIRPVSSIQNRCWDKIAPLLSVSSIHVIFIWQFGVCPLTRNGDSSLYRDFIVAVLSGVFCKPSRRVHETLSSVWNVGETDGKADGMRVADGGDCEIAVWRVWSAGGPGDRGKPAVKSYQTNQCWKC